MADIVYNIKKLFEYFNKILLKGLKLFIFKLKIYYIFLSILKKIIIIIINFIRIIKKYYIV